MRKALLLLLVLVLVLARAGFASEVIWLEPLVESAKKHRAPSNLQSFMASSQQKDLQQCQTEGNVRPRQIANYFSAIPVDLNGDRFKDYLVFPSVYCIAFFGAHSIAFWLVVGQASREFRMVFEGRHDGIEILRTKSHGFRDVHTHYGNDIDLYRYNGHTYQQVRR